MLNRTQTIQHAPEILLPLALAVAASILTWTLTEPGLPLRSPPYPIGAVGAGQLSHHQPEWREVKSMQDEQQVNTEMDLTLTELPPVGTYAGVFVDAIYGTRTDKKHRTNKMLTLVIELDKQRSDQTRFTVNTRYVLNIKGERKLRQDAQGFDQTLKAEALKKFNAYKFFVGKPCLATISYATEDGRTVARATAYQPAGETKLVPSGKYVRATKPTPAPGGAVLPPAQPPIAA